MIQNPSINRTSPQPASMRVRVSKWLSVVGSLAVILWAFSASLRKASIASNVSGEHVDRPIDPVERVTRQQVNSLDFRDAAIALDHEFMRSLEKRNSAKINVEIPSSEDVRERRIARDEELHKEMFSLAGAEEGTIQWSRREELKRTIEDAIQ